MRNATHSQNGTSTFGSFTRSIVCCHDALPGGGPAGVVAVATAAATSSSTLLMLTEGVYETHRRAQCDEVRTASGANRVARVKTEGAPRVTKPCCTLASVRDSGTLIM